MKWPIKKKEHMVGKKRKRGTANKNNNNPTLWKERGGRKCQRTVGQRLDTRNPSTWYNPLEPTATRQGKRRSQTKTEWAVSWNIETTTPHLYIVNEWYNSRNQRASKEEKNKQTNNECWKETATSPTPNPNAGGPRNRLSIELEQTNLVHRYEWWNKQG